MRLGLQFVQGVAGCLLLPVIVPILLVAIVLQKVGILKSTADWTPDEVTRYLIDFRDGTGSGWDWDDFTSVPITDLALDRIRDEASSLPLPLIEPDLHLLDDLIRRTLELMSTPSPAPDC